MCGIIGYVGRRDALPVLLEGLKKLEYRGYDSAGVAFINGTGLEVHKTSGRIEDLQKILPAPPPVTSIGLGHTRWATHGVPSSLNAHPHRAGGVVVVHNGIIENYRELRAGLIEEGYEFLSETDTEVIPQLIFKHMKSGLSIEEAIRKAISQLAGSYAIGVLSESAPRTLYAARNGSPLVLGIGDGEFFFASDVPAMLQYTRKVVFLKDGQVCSLTADGIEMADSQKPLDSAEVVDVDWTPAMAEKEGFEHFMLKEIHEQPAAVAETMREWLKEPRALLECLGLKTRSVFDLKRLQIVACGTSYHAALIGKYMIETLSHIPVDVDIASEYRYRDLILENNSLFISITQSGETADTLAAQRVASKKGAHTLTLCNVVGSTSAREAQCVLYTRAGPEIGVASTKAFTSQLAALALLGMAFGLKRGRLSHMEVETLKSQLQRIPELMKKTLLLDKQARELSSNGIQAARSFLFLGRGVNYPLALEGALKLKEISYIHAEGYPAGEMKHGPIALIEKGLPVVVIAPVDGLFEKTLSNIEEVKARGGYVIALTDEPQTLAHKADYVLQTPATHQMLSPFVNAIPLQLLAYHIALANGRDVDRPRNLAKSVTVE